MSEPSLPELEAERDRLYARLSMAGDFRRGPVSENWRKCGKPNCACAAPDHRLRDTVIDTVLGPVTHNLNPPTILKAGGVRQGQAPVIPVRRMHLVSTATDEADQGGELPKHR